MDPDKSQPILYWFLRQALYPEAKIFKTLYVKRPYLFENAQSSYLSYISNTH